MSPEITYNVKIQNHLLNEYYFTKNTFFFSVLTYYRRKCVHLHRILN